MVFGIGRYAMRLWLDPDKLAGRNLTADEVVQALREQNVQVAAGAVGAEPSQEGQSFQISVRAAGRLSESGAVRQRDSQAIADGALVRVKDVGRTELGRRVTRRDALQRARRRRFRRAAAADRELAAGVS
jgi:HAE1 family hydrophobic/amphiphilic exporter-1